MSAATIEQHVPFTWESEEHRKAALAEVIAASIENRQPYQENKPEGRMTEPAERPTPAPLPRVQDTPPPPLPASPSAVFTEADLFALTHRTQWVPMPGKRRACVHTLSLEEVGWVNAQAMEYVKRKGTLSDEDRRTWFALAVKLFQAVVCCRVSDEPGAAPIFSAKNHEAVARNLGWAKIEQIGNLSDALGLENGEQELVTDFFGLAARFSSTMCARSTNDWPASCRTAMQEFGSLATSVARRGFLLPSDLDALAVLEA
jgi:hypothetical protein